MPIKTFWDNDEKTVIRYEMYDHWTLDEFWEAYEKARAMINEVESDVHFIQIAMDAKSVGYIPNGFLTHLRSIYRNAHPRAGRTIIVPKMRGVMAQLWERVIVKTMPHIRERFDFADTLDEARAMMATTTEKITEK